MCYSLSNCMPILTFTFVTLFLSSFFVSVFLFFIQSNFLVVLKTFLSENWFTELPEDFTRYLIIVWNAFLRKCFLSLNLKTRFFGFFHAFMVSSSSSLLDSLLIITSFRMRDTKWDLLAPHKKRLLKGAFTSSFLDITL